MDVERRAPCTSSRCIQVKTGGLLTQHNNLPFFLCLQEDVSALPVIYDTEDKDAFEWTQKSFMMYNQF